MVVKIEIYKNHIVYIQFSVEKTIQILYSIVIL